MGDSVEPLAADFSAPWAALLQRTGATFIALNNYLIPSLGVIWGILFLGEALSPRAILALAIILAGIAVTRIGMRQGASGG